MTDVSQTRPMAQAAIFDLDGVLVDTMTFHLIAWQELAGRLGFSLTPEDGERLKGVSRMEALRVVLQAGGIRADEETARRWAEEKNSRYLALVDTLTPRNLLPGARELIVRLRASAVRIALASSSRNAPLIVDRLGVGDVFDAILDGSAVAVGKPDPALFLEAARRVDVPPAHCVVFEDAVAGVTAARAAGMRVVGVGDPGVLAEADVVVPGLADPAVLRFFGGPAAS